MDSLQCRVVHQVKPLVELAELAWQPKNMAEHSNPSQQNLGCDLMNHPVDSGAFDEKLANI